MRIGFLGTGTISSAVVEGIARDGHDILVSQRNPARAAELAERFANVTVADNQTVVTDSELVLIGLMPEVARKVLPELVFPAGQNVASFMADIALAELDRLIAPARAEAMVIPFPAIAKGGSPVLICPPSALLAGIFGRSNHVIALRDPAELVPYMAVQALLSPVVKLMAGAVDWAAERTGDRAQAERFLRVLIGNGLVAAPLEQAGALEALLADLNTKGGLNAQLRTHFADHGVYDRLRDGLNILEARLQKDSQG